MTVITVLLAQTTAGEHFETSVQSTAHARTRTWITLTACPFFVCVFTNESGLLTTNAFTLKPEMGSPICNYPHLYSTFPFLLKKKKIPWLSHLPRSRNLHTATTQSTGSTATQLLVSDMNQMFPTPRFEHRASLHAVFSRFSHVSIIPQLAR